MEGKIPKTLAESMALDKILASTQDDEVKVTKLMNRLHTCRDQRKEGQVNLRDVKTVQHFEFLFDQQEKEMKKTEEVIEATRKQYEEKIERLKVSLEAVLKQFDQKKLNLSYRRAYVEEKLTKARERVESQKAAKGKEEMNLEKEIKELILTYKEKQERLVAAKLPPWGQIKFAEAEKLIDFPQTYPPLPPTHPPLPAPALPPPAPKFQGKRGIKKAEDRPLPVVEDLPAPEPLPVVEPVSEPEAEEKKEEVDCKVTLPSHLTPEDHPLAKMTNKQIESLSEAEMFSYLRPDVKNPFSNVIQNSKQKRGVKKC